MTRSYEFRDGYEQGVADGRRMYDALLKTMCDKAALATTPPILMCTDCPHRAQIESTIKDET